MNKHKLIYCDCTCSRFLRRTCVCCYFCEHIDKCKAQRGALCDIAYQYKKEGKKAPWKVCNCSIPQLEGVLKEDMLKRRDFELYKKKEQ